jgi:hypothetical protein
MSFRRALAAFLLCASTPVMAMGQEGQKVEIGYDITYAGMTGFRIDFAASFMGGRYDVQSHTFKEGLIKAVTIQYDGRNRAWGSFVPGGIRPSGGSLAIMVGNKPRTWRALYGPDRSVAEEHTPPWQPMPHQTISEEQRRGSLDPLSGALLVGMAGDRACDQVVPSSDGKRRIDVVLRKVGIESPAQAGVPAAQGDLLVCEIHTRRVAGEFHDAPKEAESQRERPMRLWFARLDQTSFRYPVKLEAQTSFGTIRGSMLHFRQRPMTDQEKAAMPPA